MSEETKTESYNSLEELMDMASGKGMRVRDEVNKYKSFVQSVFGTMPKSELELVRFIKNVIDLHEKGRPDV